MRLSSAFSLLVALGLPLAAQAAQLVHNPVLQASAGQDLSIEAALVGAPAGTDVRARLHWRIKGKEQYKSVEMGGPMASLRAVVPAADVTLAGLQYYIKAVDRKQMSVETKINDVMVRKDQVGPQIDLLSPAEGAELDTGRPVITVAFGDADSGIDTRTIRIYVDGKDITRDGELQAFDSMLSFVPGSEVADGVREFAVLVGDRSGNGTKIAWKNTVKATAMGSFEGKGAQWRWDGKVQLETQYTSTSQNRDNAPLPYRPYGANRARLEVNGRGPEDTFSLNVYKTDEERSDQQPVDRYTLTWKSEAGTYAVGDFAPSFSELSLYQLYQLRGVTLDLNSGRLDEGHTRIVGVWGQTRRAIEAGSTGFAGGASTPTFAQDLLGGRWEFGGPWFQWGFNSVTVNDSRESVTDPGSQLPHYNWVSTSDMKIGVPPWGLTLSGEGGVDLYSDNSPLLGSSLGSAYRAGARLAPKGTGTQLSFEFKDLGGGFGFLPGGYTAVANPGLTPDYRGWEFSFSQGILDSQYNIGVDWNRHRDNLQARPDRAVTQNEHLSLYLNLAPNLDAHQPMASLRYITDAQVNDADGNTTGPTPHFRVDMITTVWESSLSYSYRYAAQGAASLYATWSNLQQHDRLAKHYTQDLRSDTVLIGTNVTAGSSGFNASASFGNDAQQGIAAADTQFNVDLNPRAGRNLNGSFRWTQAWVPAVFDSSLGYSLGTQFALSDSVPSQPKTERSSQRDTFSLGFGYNPARQQRLSLDLNLALVQGGNENPNDGPKVVDQVTQTQGRLRYDLSF